MGPCKEHRRHLAYLDELGREAMKARYLRLVAAFTGWEEAVAEHKATGRGDLKVRERFSALVEAAKGRAA